MLLDQGGERGSFAPAHLMRDRIFTLSLLLHTGEIFLYKLVQVAAKSLGRYGHITITFIYLHKYVCLHYTCMSVHLYTYLGTSGNVIA